MKRLTTLLAAPLLASCVDRPYFYGDEFPQHYKRPAEATSEARRIDRKEILHMAAGSKVRQRVGYLHKYEVQVAGSRETRESYTIYDSLNMKSVGFITAEGVFYRFDEYGRLRQPPVGEYPIVPTGLKAFFGFSMSDNIELADIDPYK